jgi:hypothetical protein
MPAHGFEAIFDGLAQERIFPIIHIAGDLFPILSLQRLDRGRKENVVFHGDMASFILNEVEEGGVESNPQHVPARLNALNRMRDPAEAIGAAPVLARQIANSFRRDGITRSQSSEYQILLGVMAGSWIDHKIRNNRMNDFVVWPLSALKHTVRPFENVQQHFHVAMCKPQ